MRPTDHIQTSVGRTPEVSDFLELGLLLIVTGLTGVLVGTVVLVLFLRGAGHLPEWLAAALGSVALLGIFAFAILVRRLYRFLTGRSAPNLTLEVNQKGRRRGN